MTTNHIPAKQTIPFKNKLTSRRGIRGAASGLRAAPFDTENCTFLIAAVGLPSGGSLFVCIYDLTRRRISAIFEHLALFQNLWI